MAQRKFLIDGGFEVNADSSITGNLDMTGHVIPTVDSDGTIGYDLGTPTMKWRDLYLSKGSLYIDGQKVLQSDAGTIVVQADPDQSLLTKTTGAGVLTFQSPNPIAISATLQMGTGKKITSADANAVVFGDKVDMDNNQIINIALPTADGHAASKKYVDDKFDDVLGGAPAALDTLNELANALGDDANFAGSVTTALATKATITYVDAEIATAISSANTNTTNVTGALDTRVTTLESTTATNSSNITTLQGSVASNATDIAANSQAVVDAIATAAADATSKANAAQATATAYTDTRETAITTAYTNAIATAVAEKDEISELSDVSLGSVSNNQYLKYNSTSGLWVNASPSTDHMLEGGTNLFYTDARVADYLTGNNYATESYATTAADAAEADAITAANEYTDAEIATATASLQAYTDTAETDANAYTDTREIAITSAYQAYADAAETDAKTYTDTRETEITTAYQAYADAAETDAKAYTDTRETAITTAYQTYADTAEADAKSYADGIVSAEATTRATADTTLQNNIDVEKGRIDAILNAADADKDTFAEIVTFINAVDTTNDTALGTEITTRAAADSALQSQIDNINTDLVNDTTPQLGGKLDTNGNAIGDTYANLTFSDSGIGAVSGNVIYTGTYNKLYLNRGSLVFTDSGDSPVTITAPTNWDSSYTLTLPTNAGSSGQVLTTNGSGVLSFADVVTPTDLTHEHGDPVIVTSAQSASSDTSTVGINLGVTGLVHYSVYINRMLMRPTEYTYNSSTGVVTFATGTLTTNDELEITGLSL
jgi:hypothetical protein